MLNKLTFKKKKKCDKPHTYLLKGMSDDTRLEDVEEALKSSQNIQFCKIERFKTNQSIKNKRELPIFLVQIKPEYKVQDLLKISTVSYQKIHWEKINKRNLTQCRNCQRFGHISGNCGMPFRCVKCIGSNHKHGECPPDKETAKEDLSCISCGQKGHPASFHGCPKAIEIKKKLLEKKTEAEDKRSKKIINSVPSAGNKQTFANTVKPKTIVQTQTPTPVKVQPNNQENRLRKLEDHMEKIVKAIQEQQATFSELFACFSDMRRRSE